MSSPQILDLTMMQPPFSQSAQQVKIKLQRLEGEAGLTPDAALAYLEANGDTDLAQLVDECRLYHSQL